MAVVSMTVRLEELLAAAPQTGPRLLRLDEQRDAVRLLIDMGTEMRKVRPYISNFDALLARLDRLGNTTIEGRG